MGADISVENISKMLETFAENMDEEILLLDSNRDKLIGATQKEYQNTNTQDAFILALNSSMEQIAESVQQLALHATELNSLTVDTRENSQKAQKRMRRK